MKRNIWIGLAVAAGLVILLSIGQYNSLVKDGEAVDGSWSQVENVLQRRADLVPNLVETVKGYAAHEKQIFTDVAEARSRLLGAKGPAATQAANQGFASALGRLLAIAENYPDLKANQNFLALQDELAGSENRIAVERRRYNERVRAFNTRIRRFPTNILANLFAFDRRNYFEATEGAETVPKVEFKAETSAKVAPGTNR
jgi:LemA protein